MAHSTGGLSAIAVADGDDHSSRAIARVASGWAVLRVTGPEDARAALQDDAVRLICAGADDELGMELLATARKDRPELPRILLVPPADGALLIEWVNQARPSGVLQKPLDDERVQKIFSELQRDPNGGASRSFERDWEQTFDILRTPVAIVGADWLLLRTNRAGQKLAAAAGVSGGFCHLVLFGKAEPCRGCPIGSLGDVQANAQSEISFDKKSFRVHAYRLDSGSTICFYEDLAAERRRLTRAVAAEKLLTLGELVAGVAHEINNPIANILAFAELLRAGPLDAEQADMLASIEASALRCKRTIITLLRLFQRDARKGVVRLADCVQEAILLFKMELESRPKLVLQVDLPPTLPSVWGNAGQLQQVFLRLLENAGQAMPDEGTIAVSAGLEGGETVFVRVADTGGGIGPEQLPHLFKPTFTARPDAATGFGLAIAQAIVHEHGGVIDVESQIGRGTTMTVRLPIHGGRE